MNLRRKTQTSLNILLIILSAIYTTGCNKDNETPNAGYNLKLSTDECKVVQWKSITIPLTSHENTTLEILNPNIIECVYTWSEGWYYNAKIEIKGKNSGETEIIVRNNHTNETALLKVKVGEFPMPRIKANKLSGDIFDMFVFNLYTENSEQININDLFSVCDSIVWSIDGLKSSYFVFGNIDNGIHLSFKWSQCFMYPGKYKTRLSAWRDNSIIYTHKCDLSLSNTKDFLCYNWNDIDISNSTKYWTGYVDVLNSSINLISNYGNNGASLYAEVKLSDLENTDSCNILYNYLYELYSTPTYKDEADKNMMREKYDELFSQQKKYPNAIPIAIWKIERSNIALLYLGETFGVPSYMIYAEPAR